jgi:hypothetical protein
MSGSNKEKWLGRKYCDFCGIELSTQEFFVYGKTKFSQSSLGFVMCMECWSKHGIGRLGPGFGRMYNGKTFEIVRNDRKK